MKLNNVLILIWTFTVLINCTFPLDIYPVYIIQQWDYDD